MEQNEIDERIAQSQGSTAESHKKQEELKNKMSENTAPASSSPTPGKKDNPGGQITRGIGEEEAGANPVAGYLENIRNIVLKQKDFIKDITNKYAENPDAINIIEVLAFLDYNTTVIEKHIEKTIEALQLQDIGKQKVMKVISMMSQLKDNLDNFFGTDEELEKQFGIRVGKEKTPEPDSGKAGVENNVSLNQAKGAESISNSNTAISVQVNNQDVDKIAAELLVEEKISPGKNKDIDDIINEFQQKKKEK